jgi:hypothetical protein
MMPSLIESVVEGFPFPTVHPIIGEPNYESIAALHQQLNANAASVPSHLGNGALGQQQQLSIVVGSGDQQVTSKHPQKKERL